jgi:hypothetical protein
MSLAGSRFSSDSAPGTGGTVVSVIAYKGDYIAAQDELKVIDATARDKKLQNPGKLEQHFRHQVRGDSFGFGPCGLAPLPLLRDSFYDNAG